jgi:hypothetical protein
LRIPVADTTLILHSDGTTENLEALTRGLASVPTGSTLLSALWPSEHAIMDIRDYQVVVGLLAHNGAQVVDANEAASLYSPDWGEYRWFRHLMTMEAARLELSSPLLLERALYVAYNYRPQAADGMTWSQWGAILKGHWHSQINTE